MEDNWDATKLSSLHYIVGLQLISLAMLFHRLQLHLINKFLGWLMSQLGLLKCSVKRNGLYMPYLILIIPISLSILTLLIALQGVMNPNWFLVLHIPTFELKPKWLNRSLSSYVAFCYDLKLYSG